MNLSSILFWVKAVIVGVVLTLSMYAGSKITAGIKNKEIAELQRDWAKERAELANKAFKAQTRTNEVLVAQGTTKQEIDHDALERSTRLNARIASERVRQHSTKHSGCDNVPVISDAPTELVTAPTELAPPQARGSTGTLQASIEADAARDAQQLAELIDAQYRLAATFDKLRQ